MTKPTLGYLKCNVDFMQFQQHKETVGEKGSKEIDHEVAVLLEEQ
jgi:hypothetical protein